MSKRKVPPAPAVDMERAAAIARARRAQECEAEVKAILARHRCAIQVLQTWTNGQPGPLTIQIVALEQGG
jgi:hypothetical protein